MNNLVFYCKFNTQMTPINFKLINLLNSFSNSELKEFKKFISSPLNSSGRNYLPLLDHLIKHKTTGLDNIYARDVYEKLYPGKKFSTQTLKNRFSELYKLGEEFLIFLGLKNNKTEKEKILLKMLIERKLFSPFGRKYSSLVNQLEREKYDNTVYHDLAIIKNLNIDYLKDKKDMKDIHDQYFGRTQIVICINLIELFEFGLEFSLMEYDNKTFESNHVVEFLKNLEMGEIINSFKRSDNLIFQITAMNYLLYKAYENHENEEEYFQAHKIFSQISEKLKDDYKISFMNFMTYYCMRKQNLGSKNFQQELFNLFNEKLSQGLFADLKTPIYVLNNFRDYVYIGLALRKFRWVEDFINKYGKELPSEFREDEINLSYAKLNIAYRHYEKSLSNLKEIRTVNYLLYLDSSVFKLCCYYELGKFEEAFLEIDKIRHYLRNHKEIPDVHKEPGLHFVRIYQKLLKANSMPEKSEAGYLEKEVMKLMSVSRKDWLVEKIAELNY